MIAACAVLVVGVGIFASDILDNKLTTNSATNDEATVQEIAAGGVEYEETAAANGNFENELNQNFGATPSADGFAAETTAAAAAVMPDVNDVSSQKTACAEDKDLAAGGTAYFNLFINDDSGADYSYFKVGTKSINVYVNNYSGREITTGVDYELYTADNSGSWRLINGDMCFIDIATCIPDGAEKALLFSVDTSSLGVGDYMIKKTVEGQEMSLLFRMHNNDALTPIEPTTTTNQYSETPLADYPYAVTEVTLTTTDSLTGADEILNNSAWSCAVTDKMTDDIADLYSAGGTPAFKASTEKLYLYVENIGTGSGVFERSWKIYKVPDYKAAVKTWNNGEMSTPAGDVVEAGKFIVMEIDISSLKSGDYYISAGETEGLTFKLK